MYAVPPVQVEGSGVFLADTIEEIKKNWYGAMEVFETDGETLATLKKKFGKKQVPLGGFCRWLREKYKLVDKDGEFWFDTNPGPTQSSL